jgi:hypothetical protein
MGNLVDLRLELNDTDSSVLAPFGENGSIPRTTVQPFGMQVVAGSSYKFRIPKLHSMPMKRDERSHRACMPSHEG